MAQKKIDAAHVLRHFKNNLPDDLRERLTGRPLMEYGFYQRISSNHKMYFFSCCDAVIDLTRGWTG